MMQESFLFVTVFIFHLYMVSSSQIYLRKCRFCFLVTSNETAYANMVLKHFKRFGPFSAPFSVFVHQAKKKKQIINKNLK